MLKVTVEDLVEKSFPLISIDRKDDKLIIVGKDCGFMDIFDQNSIDSIDMDSKSIRIQSKHGTVLGNHNVIINLDDGEVVSDGVSHSSNKVQNGSAKARKPRFTPAINGFSLSKVQTMPSEDGDALHCFLRFNKKVVGEFLDRGDGGEYSFFEMKGFSSSKIEEVVRTFPMETRDIGLGPIIIPCNIGILVDRLFNMANIAKVLNKLEARNKDYICVDDWKKGIHLAWAVPKEMKDADVEYLLRQDIKKRYKSEDFSIKRYRSLDELSLVDTMVSEEMLKSEKDVQGSRR
ncbi:MAG: hypothetical protein WC102_00640 [Saccharofermentanales bacterium]